MKVRYCPDTDTLYIEFRAGDIAETKDLDENTQVSAGLHAAAPAPDAAKALTKFLTAPEAAPIIRKTGMEPG